MFKTFILLLAFLSLSQAKEQKLYPFFGLYTSSESLDFSSEPKESKNHIALTYGKQSLTWRTTFTLGYTQDSYYNASVKIDKILLDSLFGTPKIRPYLGTTFGYLHYKKASLPTVTSEQDGFYLGGNIGLILYATDQIDIDMGYHYYQVNQLDFLDTLKGASLSIHYFF